MTTLRRSPRLHSRVASHATVRQTPAPALSVSRRAAPAAPAAQRTVTTDAKAGFGTAPLASFGTVVVRRSGGIAGGNVARRMELAALAPPLRALWDAFRAATRFGAEDLPRERLDSAGVGGSDLYKYEVSAGAGSGGSESWTHRFTATSSEARDGASAVAFVSAVLGSATPGRECADGKSPGAPPTPSRAAVKAEFLDGRGRPLDGAGTPRWPYRAPMRTKGLAADADGRLRLRLYMDPEAASRGYRWRLALSPGLELETQEPTRGTTMHEWVLRTRPEILFAFNPDGVAFVVALYLGPRNSDCEDAEADSAPHVFRLQFEPPTAAVPPTAANRPTRRAAPQQTAVMPPRKFEPPLPAAPTMVPPTSPSVADSGLPNSQKTVRFSEDAVAAVPEAQRPLAFPRIPASRGGERSSAETPRQWFPPSLRWPVWGLAVHVVLAFANVFTPMLAVLQMQILAVLWLIVTGAVWPGHATSIGVTGHADGQSAQERWRARPARATLCAMLLLFTVLNMLLPVLVVRLGLLAVSLTAAYIAASRSDFRHGDEKPDGLPGKPMEAALPGTDAPQPANADTLAHTHSA